MKNLKANDTVIIYKDTPTFMGGDLAKVLDRDAEDNTYLVSSLEHVFQYGGDVETLMKSSAKWVKRENLKLVVFEKKSFWKRLLELFING